MAGGRGMTLRPPAQVCCSGIPLPGDKGEGQRELGFAASARTLVRLNLVSWRLFPLPHSLRPAEAGGSTQGDAQGVCGVVRGGLLSRIPLSEAWDDGDFPRGEGGGGEGLNDPDALQEAAIAERPQLKPLLEVSAPGSFAPSSPWPSLYHPPASQAFAPPLLERPSKTARPPRAWGAAGGAPSPCLLPPPSAVHR